MIYKDWIQKLIFTPDNKYLISGSGDFTLKIFEILKENIN